MGRVAIGSLRMCGVVPRCRRAAHTEASHLSIGRWRDWCELRRSYIFKSPLDAGSWFGRRGCHWGQAHTPNGPQQPVNLLL